MSATVSAAELTARVRARRRVRLDEKLALEFLRYWESRGIAEERLGRWRLTSSGRAMFGGWAVGIDLADEEQAA